MSIELCALASNITCVAYSQGKKEGKESREAQEQLEQTQSPLTQPVKALPQQTQASPLPKETHPSQAFQVGWPCLIFHSSIPICLHPSHFVCFEIVHFSLARFISMFASHHQGLAR